MCSPLRWWEQGGSVVWLWSRAVKKLAVRHVSMGDISGHTLCFLQWEREVDQNAGDCQPGVWLNPGDTAAHTEETAGAKLWGLGSGQIPLSPNLLCPALTGTPGPFLGRELRACQAHGHVCLHALIGLAVSFVAWDSAVW